MPGVADSEIIITDRAGDWKKFLQSRYKSDLAEITREYPYRKSIYIDYEKILKFGKVGLTLADEVVQKPGKAIDDIRDALKNYNLIFTCDQEAENENINIRFINFIRKDNDLRALTHKKIDTLISFECVIKKVALPVSHATKAVFKCLQCGTLTPPYAQGYRKWVKPFRNCSQCERQTQFEYVSSLSTIIDVELMRVQEPPELMKGGQEPAIIDLDVRDDLCDLNLSPGNRVIVNGILKTIQIIRGGSPTPYFERYVEVNSFELLDEDYEDIRITEEEEEEILKISKSQSLKADFIQSVAPSIYGHDDIKFAMLLQLFGGITTGTGGELNRGWIHVLIISDPGMAKSKMGDGVVKLAPHGKKASGRGSTGAGLTASAIKDESFGGSNGWTVEAGAIVLAHNGLLVVDEADKMRIEDRGQLHGCMEQGELVINKAGMSISLKTYTAVLMFANPKNGRFDIAMPIAPQINGFDPALLSRFDLIFAMNDIPDIDKDDKIAKKILDTHWQGEHLAAGKEYNGVQVTPRIDPDLVKKYVAYSRRIFPVMTQEAYNFLNKFYVEMRQINGESITVPITARQLEGPIRLAEAYARMNLSEKVTLEHAETVVNLIKDCLQKLGFDKVTGQMDIDKLTSSVSTRERTVVSEIQDLLDGCDGRCSVNMLYTTLRYKGFQEDAISHGIDYLQGEKNIRRDGGMIVKGGYFDD